MQGLLKPLDRIDGLYLTGWIALSPHIHNDYAAIAGIFCMFGAFLMRVYTNATH